MQKLLSFAAKNINVFAIFQDRNLNIASARTSLSLEQLGLNLFFKLCSCVRTRV